MPTRTQGHVKSKGAAVIGAIVTAFLLFAFAPVVKVNAQSSGCTVDDLKKGARLDNIAFPVNQRTLKPGDQFYPNAELIFDAATKAKCENTGDIAFNFKYTAPGYEISSGTHVVQGSPGDGVDPNTKAATFGYTATDYVSFSGLTGKGTIPQDAQLSVSVTVFKGLSQVAGPKSLTITITGTPAASPQTPSTPSTPAAGTGVDGRTLSAAATPKGDPDCEKQFGPGYTKITNTQLCVPPSPVGNGGLAGSTTVGGVLVIVIRILLVVSGSGAVLFIVIGGFMYLTSAGNEEQSSKGRKAITYAVVGLVIVILSYTIVNILVRTLTSSPDQIIGGGSTTVTGGGGTNPDGRNPGP